MSGYIGLIETAYEVDSKQWLLAEPKVKINASLDISKFNQTGTSQVVTITVSGGAGTFTATVNGATTPAQPWNVSLATLQAAIQALPTVGSGYEGLAGPGSSGYTQFPGGVAVTGTPGTSYVLTFQGALASQKVVASAVGAGGATASAANTTAGVTAHYPNGYIPSGCGVGLVTATGLYGPYDPTLSNGQQVFAGLTYAPARVVWQAGGTTTIADKVSISLVVYDALVSLSHLPFQVGSGAVDSAAKTAVPQISYQP